MAFLIIGGISNNLNAQADVTISPVGLLFGDLNIGADFIVTEPFSLEATVGLGAGEDDFTGLKHINVPVTVFGKYYFSPKHGGDRFYADAFLRFVNRNYTTKEGSDDKNYAEYTQSRFGLGFGLGYKAVSASGFVFDIGLGAGRAFVDNTKFKSDGEEREVDWPELMFVGKLGLGYRFGAK